ncbi:hypothetical protein HYU09_05430 [Candidatus Woesearchaeota archaeon]|nr:hypothetical protein [Candidatus Woesearchaeota archaeon]
MNEPTPMKNVKLTASAITVLFGLQIFPVGPLQIEHASSLLENNFKGVYSDASVRPGYCFGADKQNTGSASNFVDAYLPDFLRPWECRTKNPTMAYKP